jgi:hypothetical protein
MYVHDETANETTEATITGTAINDYYLQITFTYTFTEGKFYTFRLENNSIVTYKDKIFATDQEPEDYSINNGKYIANTTTNKFITP